MEKAPVFLGILGGLGPLCGAEFYRRIISFTEAKSDRDHISVLLDGATTTPDRSAFLCKKSEQDPSDDLLTRGQRLVRAGAQVIAIPCNTAHSFYPKLCQTLSVPILHIVTETAAQVFESGAKTVGILGTGGTKSASLYDTALSPLGVKCRYPTPLWQKKLDTLITQIKAGKDAKSALLAPFLRHLNKQGCEQIILGCTELSLCANRPTANVIDSLSALARRCVLACGKPLSQAARRSGGEAS